MELRRFLEKVAADTPTPGGGSASALAGALSASLVAMVAGLSFKKGQLKKGRIEQIREKALLIRDRLIQAIIEDSKSFDAVMKAIRLPKNSEKERLYRSRRIQKAYQNATLSPRLVCRLSIQLLEYSKLFILKGNPNTLSDAGVAAFLADAALAGGLLNIGINLAALTDKKFIGEMNRFIRRWTRERNRLMKEIRIKLYPFGIGRSFAF
ncbi:MAG: cyclodeaminase/cyclohydrolase family protein [Syntrophaceae bacterium]|nr:cyclodeaminase/cyclohydrolase family protein [Syntrophaceae bacterium]